MEHNPEWHLAEAERILYRDCQTWESYEGRTNRAQAHINLALAASRIGEHNEFQG